MTAARREGPVISTNDLDDILEHSERDLRHLRGARILVTGATGFVGTWLLHALVYANARLETAIRVVAMTRDPVRFRRERPEIAGDGAIEVFEGDVRSSDAFARIGAFDAVVHAATAADAAYNAAQPHALLDTVIDGTRNTLEAAARNGSIPFLLTSSGAVYGRQPPQLARMTEDFRGGPDQLDSRFVYHESKRIAELLCAMAVEAAAPRATIARLFAFAGPFLPIDRHFAIGNFVRDTLRRDATGRASIVISGDGTPVRTYLYAGDLTSWLLRVLVAGMPGRAYNVGAEREIDIAGTARLVAAESRAVTAIEIRGVPDPNALPERYVPSTDRARAELGLEAWTGLEDGVRRWRRAYGE